MGIQSLSLVSCRGSHAKGKHSREVEQRKRQMENGLPSSQCPCSLTLLDSLRSWPSFDNLCPGLGNWHETILPLAPPLLNPGGVSPFASQSQKVRLETFLKEAGHDKASLNGIPATRVSCQSNSPRCQHNVPNSHSSPPLPPTTL